MRRGVERVLLLVALSSGTAGWAAAEPALRQRCLEHRQTVGGSLLCKRAVKAYPKDPVVRRSYAISLAYDGSYGAATEQFQVVARLEPANHRAHYEVAWIHAFTGAYGPAVAPIERAMSLNPGSLKYMQLAAIIYASTRQLAKRFALVAAAARRGDQISMFELGHMYAEGWGTRRDLSQAVVWLTRAAKRGHVVAMDHLADAYLNGKLGLARNRKRAAYWARRAQRARTE